MSDTNWLDRYFIAPVFRYLGANLPQRSEIEIVGGTVVDDPVNLRTVITVAGTTANTLVGDGSGYSVISGSAGIKYIGNPKTVEYDLPINALTPTTAATPILTFATTTARAYSVRGIVRVQNSPVSAYGEFEVSAFAYNNAGTLTVVGATPITTKVNVTGFSMTFAAVGTNLVLSATDSLGPGRRWTGRIYIAESSF